MASRTDGNMLLFGIVMGILGNFFASSMFAVGGALISKEFSLLANFFMLIISGFGFFYVYHRATGEVKQMKEEDDCTGPTINNSISLIRIH